MSSASIISVKFHLGYFVFFVRLPYPRLNQRGVCVISNSNNRQIAQRQTENSRYVTRNSFCLFTAQCNFHLSKEHMKREMVESVGEM